LRAALSSHGGHRAVSERERLRSAARFIVLEYLLEIDQEPILDLTNGRVRRVLRVSGVRMLAEPWWALPGQGEEALTQASG
jgi:hypothetical protein